MRKKEKYVIELFKEDVDELLKLENECNSLYASVFNIKVAEELTLDDLSFLVRNAICFKIVDLINRLETLKKL